MASSSPSHGFLCISTLQSQSQPHRYPLPLKSLMLTSKSHCLTRLRIAPKASSRNNSGSTGAVETPDARPSSSEPPQHSASPDSFSSLLCRFRNVWFKFDELGMEILSIALPAALALAADPLASLIDTAFVGHIGSVELAAVGVSASVFNLVSKVFNVPLLNITTSYVAEEQALIGKEDSIHNDSSDFSGEYQSKKHLPSVSTSLALAAALGIAETVALSLGSGILMNIMGFSHAWIC